MHIHKPKSNTQEPLPPEPLKSIVYYAKDGKTFEKDNAQCCAYQTINGEENLYFVKCTNDRFRNPWHEEMANFTWKKVKQHVFLTYVKFLQTNRQTLLIEAEREFIYG